jgi:hypothetical protein
VVDFELPNRVRIGCVVDLKIPNRVRIGCAGDFAVPNRVIFWMRGRFENANTVNLLMRERLGTMLRKTSGVSVDSGRFGRSRHAAANHPGVTDRAGRLRGHPGGPGSIPA